MSLPSYYGWLETEQVGDVTVVRFTARAIVGTEAVNALGDQLLSLAETEDNHKLLLNFAHVESVTGAMVGKLIALHKKVRAGNGQLVFCHLGPFLIEIFNLLHLTQLVRICADEQEALRTLSTGERV